MACYPDRLMPRRVIAAAVVIGLAAWWWARPSQEQESGSRALHALDAARPEARAELSRAVEPPRETGQRAGRVLSELAKRAAAERDALARHEADEAAKYCEIRGRVVRSDGLPAGDGAVERVVDGAFERAGELAPNGTFRWRTTQRGDVVLRAWPWHSPATASRTFACAPGARFDIELRVPDEQPAITGTIVDSSGAPLPFAFVDVEPLDGGVAQQERADGDGRFAIFDAPAGRYKLSNEDAGATATVLAPQDGVTLSSTKALH